MWTVKEMSGERPSETTVDAIKILAEYYSFKTLTVAELVSYDCRNFAVEVVPLSRNNIDKDKESEAGNKVANDREEGTVLEESRLELVLKIFNARMSTGQRLQKTQQQVICSQFLRQRGFHCPQVVHTNEGELLGKTTSQCYTLLMTKLPGQQLGADHSRITPTVLFEMGALLARLHLTLQEGDPQYLETDPTDPWVLENIHLLFDYLYSIQDEDERSMLEGIITRFDHIRHDKFPVLNKGIIHGDFHDYNVIVDWGLWDSQAPPSSPTPRYITPVPVPPSLHHHQRHILLQKYGIIDFEDMTVSYPALELSRLIADMMIDCHQVPLLDIGGYVIAGYASVDRTPVEQFGLCLYDTALACLAQYIVLSTHEYQIQEEPNEYCMLSTEESREVLGKLKAVDAAEVYSAWGEILTRYGCNNRFTE